MGQTPEQVRADIEQTRSELAADINAIDYKVNPKKVVSRKVESTRATISGLKYRIMGGAGSVKDSTTQTGSTVKDGIASGFGTAKDSTVQAGTAVKDQVSSVASSTTALVSSAPQKAKQQTQGAPFLAGAVAVGFGYLLGSLIPASKVEVTQASTLKSKAQDASGPVKEQLKQVAQDVKEQIQPTVQQAVDEVKSTAQSGVDEVKSTAQTGVQDVKSQTQDSAQEIRSNVQSGSEDGETPPPRTAPDTQRQYSDTY